MKNYFSVEEISTELGVAQNTLRKRIKELGFDTQKLGITELLALKDSVQNLLKTKKANKDSLDAVKNLKLDKSGQLDVESVSNVEKLRIKAIERYNILEDIAKKCIYLLNLSEDNVDSNPNGTKSINPNAKLLNDVTKQQIALGKAIKDYEEALKLIATTSDSKSPIDD